ncbi:16S rRNA (guanine(966)-N(2))-methyltransferase RsmD [Oharaeibacter diazotrophicus]|uniref:16S rRNA (Guanine966-N2)-methyltransferase n=2 Tax=Oharaeibacter diazotrophicus TaxID=1920512 RepID=A0A4R6RBK4_9HYPH|nr:16S rRNA (guanine(966)-N(2))-methyltransferase RsmD [Oharaeibacter diazotrophicus]TDP83439.1 16S rRNA (guanine966-N2)-methyltransferase [Oharaeibacter diazotrophicus]BBE72272.1 ribosomal RNA small subunit methyltransferase D [Pleomorphomonas sp. SM30]GLS79042.1 DNA methyltransferase [Oharaeibacter diazotrophicus]
MRIVGGRFRGTALAGPAEGSLAIRPTTDRLRESLFNILEHAHHGVLRDARVLDLFAGTGALGFEAMSRGAKACLFVEESAEARGIIRRNQEALGLTGTTRIFRRDATDMGPVGTAEPYTLAFLDPPYGKGLADAALAALKRGGWLVPGALVVVEETAKAEIAWPAGFEPVDRRVYGDTAIAFATAG